MRVAPSADSEGRVPPERPRRGLTPSGGARGDPTGAAVGRKNTVALPMAKAAEETAHPGITGSATASSVKDTDLGLGHGLR